MWLVTGTDSGFEGIMSLYYMSIGVVLTPVEQPLVIGFQARSGPPRIRDGEQKRITSKDYYASITKGTPPDARRIFFALRESNAHTPAPWLTGLANQWERHVCFRSYLCKTYTLECNRHHWVQAAAYVQGGEFVELGKGTCYSADHEVPYST